MKTMIAAIAFMISSVGIQAQETPKTLEQAPATIHIYRPKRGHDMAVKPALFLDEKNIGKIHNGTNITLTVTPGLHTIHSDDKESGIELTAEPGGIYYVRIDLVL